MLQPGEESRRFVFEADDCLYRDHHGRRVVADVEGSGFYSIEPSETTNLTFQDEVQVDLFQGQFSRNLTVVATGTGQVSVRVLLGRVAPVGDTPSAVSLPFSGSGWVMGAASPITVDDRHEVAVAPSPAFPVPFSRKVEGEGQATIVEAAQHCTLLDSFSIGDPSALKGRAFKVQNIGDVRLLRSFFADGVEHEAPVASHLNTASWEVSLPPETEGLILRKIYDRFHGRQRARVLVDEHFVGWWYEPREDRACRWAVADFGIPAQFVHGQPSVRIAIDPPSGVPLWSVSTIEVYSIQSAREESQT